MKWLVTGGKGQLGRAFYKKLFPNHEVYALSKNRLDVTDHQSLHQLMGTYQPDYVIHAAAYTAVDQCEKEPKKAVEVNSLGSLNVAQVCKKFGTKLFYISSDYVFDGEKGKAYLETDDPNPINKYGLSKWVGEQLVLRVYPESYIVRTSWLYGHEGDNFVNTMRKFAKSGKNVRVVSDQFGCPTYTEDFAEKCLEILGSTFGIYHICNQGSCSWFEFAKTIYKEEGSDIKLVKPVTTAQYGTLAPRPSYSVLKMEKLNQLGISAPRSWQSALKEFIGKENNID